MLSKGDNFTGIKEVWCSKNLLKLMHIEIKRNQITIEFTEEETHYIEQKVGNSEIENISNYMKGKLIKALSLDVLEKGAMSNVGKDFNLNKIKNVTAELKKSNYKADKSPLAAESPLKEQAGIETGLAELEENSVMSASDENESDDAGEITAEEIGDELLADLLDKDLLKGRKKPKKQAQ